MKIKFLKIFIFITFLVCSSCKQKSASEKVLKTKISNSVKYAKGFSIHKYEGFSIIKVMHPWPNASKEFTYILKEKSAKIPDSLQQFLTIQVPIQSIIVTSTTHIPSLEMLNVETTLVGFPNNKYISSEKVRRLIDQNKIKELGNNQSLNTETIIDLAPDLIVGYGIDNNNPTLDNLEKSGLKIVFNGDWNEQTPLGKAEWIKLFGALYGLENRADVVFSEIEKEYNSTLNLMKKVTKKPTVLAGAIYESQWFLPQGNSWGALFIKDAGGNYLWNETKGTGSLALPFESVLEKAKNAKFWIGPGEFTSLKEMAEKNGHYAQFDAFQSKNIYSFSIKKGKTGGVIYYELAPNRPDLVLKDMVKILHPELLPNYKLFFFEQLR